MLHRCYAKIHYSFWAICSSCFVWMCTERTLCVLCIVSCIIRHLSAHIENHKPCTEYESTHFAACVRIHIGRIRVENNVILFDIRCCCCCCCCCRLGNTPPPPLIVKYHRVGSTTDAISSVCHPIRCGWAHHVPRNDIHTHCVSRPTSSRHLDTTIFFSIVITHYSNSNSFWVWSQACNPPSVCFIYTNR